MRGHHFERADHLLAAAGRLRRPYERHTSAWKQIDALPGITNSRWTEADRRAWGRAQFLKRKARDLGVDLPEVPGGVSGVYRGRDGLTRLHLAQTRETLRVSPQLISAQSRGPGPSDQAIRAMLDVAQRWQSITLTGPADYQLRAARMAAARGVRLSGAAPEIAQAWQQERQKVAQRPCARCGRHPCQCTADKPAPTPAQGVAGYAPAQLAALAELGKTLRREQRERIVADEIARRREEQRNPASVPVPRPEPPRN